MAHARETILDAIETEISGNGVTVERTRAYPSDEAQLPRYMIYQTGETIDWPMSSSTAIMRRLTVVVEIIVQSASGAIEDAINDQAEYVENQLLYAAGLGGSVSMRLQNSTYNWNGEGQVALGIATLTFEVEYRTVIGDVSTAV